MAQRAIGLTLWSLAIPDTVRSIEAAAELGFECAQLSFQEASDLEPARLERIAAALRRTGLHSVAGMVGFAGEDYSSIPAIRRTGGLVPAGLFPERLRACRRQARAYAALGTQHVTTHVGFIPPVEDAHYDEVLDRIGEGLDVLAEAGLTVGLETGQETGAELLRFLDDLGRTYVSVNYDPANLILYGSDDPVSAARLLGPRVTLAHVKDAVASDKPGEAWGTEVPLGQGEVDFPGVLAALAEGGYEGPLVIEREGGKDRAKELAAARRWLENLLAQAR